MTKLLKASLLLATPLLFAYGDNDNRSMDDGMTLSLGFEGSAGILEQSWGVITTDTGTIEATSPVLSHFINNTSFRYAEANDKTPNYNFGGAAIVRTQLAEDFKLMLRFGLSTGADDAKMAGTGGAAAAKVAVPVAPAATTWKSKMAMSPAAFLGYDCLYVGAEYFMQEFEVTNGDALATFEKNAGFKENQILFGLRGEMNYDMEDISLIVSVEAMSNFGAKSDSEAESYYKGLVQNQAQITTANDTGSVTPSDEGHTFVARGSNASAAISYTSSHTNITRVSVNIGMMFVDF